MKLTSPYIHKDEVIILEDGRWLMTYSPRAGGLALSDNRALVKCMEARIPLGVFKQLTNKTDRYHGSTYHVLGLGLITNWLIVYSLWREQPVQKEQAMSDNLQIGRAHV